MENISLTHRYAPSEIYLTVHATRARSATTYLYTCHRRAVTNHETLSLDSKSFLCNTNTLFLHGRWPIICIRNVFAS